eukprot:TRINITY_DN3053_c1_g6_i1.p1 TRINITY_DN3053_c1_g6~~TRINITY_DN3053_c1_g6_i1.p1  ORF type:complete len:736 (+),score=102.93 TRINITY_DN3053_c1_g6_i1:62-2209(+)
MRLSQLTFLLLLFISGCSNPLAKHVVTQSRKIPEQRRTSPETEKVLSRLRPVLEKKRVLMKRSEAEMRKLEGHPGSDLAIHIIRRRQLRLKVLDALQGDILDTISDFEALLRNFSTPGLIDGIARRLIRLKHVSIETADAAAEADTLEKDEVKQKTKAMNERNTNLDTNPDSAIDKMISKIDGEIGQILDEIDKGNTAGALFTKARSINGSEVETVVKLTSDEGKQSHTKDDAGIVSHLIDHTGNQYVLSMPRDSFVHYEDNLLTQDIIRIVCLCFVCGCVARLANLPLFFGYMMCGIILSPSELNLLGSIVQIETVAQLGIYFLLFLLGVEFSLTKLRSVLKAAIGGGVACMAILILLCILVLPGVFKAPIPEATLVGFCVSLSSTIVVMRMMTPLESGMQYGQLLLAILVIQDVCLGLMVAAIPILKSPTFESSLFVWMLVWLGMLGMVSAVISKYIIPHFMAFIGSSIELLVLGICAYTFLAMAVTEKMGLSMEVGCFMAGMTISPHRKWVHLVEELLTPLQNFFGALFFASIGIHISTSFLLREAGTLCVITFSVVSIKWLVGFLIFRFCFGLPNVNASLVGLGLSQMSEFSFVIAAHGKSVGLINREVYFMLLGITALSLIVTPIIWKFHPKPITAQSNTGEMASHALAIFKTKTPKSPRASVDYADLDKFVWAGSFSNENPGLDFNKERVCDEVLTNLEQQVLNHDNSP